MALLPIEEWRKERGASALRAALEKRALLGDASPGPWECFGIVRDRIDLTELMEMAYRAKKSPAARRELNERIKRDVGLAAQRLKSWLYVRRGRPRGAKRREVWLAALELREGNPRKYSWAALARELTPKDYEENCKLAADRIRHGVNSVKRLSLR